MRRPRIRRHAGSTLRQPPTKRAPEERGREIHRTPGRETETRGEGETEYTDGEGEREREREREGALWM